MRYETENDAREKVWRYGIRASFHSYVPCMSVTPTERITEVLLQERKDAIQERDELLAVQKQLGQANDRDGAKLIKQLSQEQMRRYRAVRLHIPWFVADPPGDCRQVVLPALWPLDLEAELDAVGRLILVTSWGEPSANAGVTVSSGPSD